MPFLTPTVHEDIIDKDGDLKSKYCLKTLFIKSMKTARSLISLKYINAKFILTISSTEGYLWEFAIFELYDYS